MNRVVSILIERDKMTESEAISLIKDTINELVSDPGDADEIIAENLGLEPDYIDDLLEFT